MLLLAICFDRRFLDRNRVFLKLLEKSFAQPGGFDEKIALCAVVRDEHGTVQDILVHEAAAACGGYLEGQTASANALGLVSHILHALAADRDLEALQPGVQAAAKFDFAALGADGLCLKVEDD